MRIYLHGMLQSALYAKLSRALRGEGIVVAAIEEPFDFALPMADRGTEAVAAIAAKQGVYFPPADFVNKQGLDLRCQQAGLQRLPVTPLSIDAVSECTYPHFIIKPLLWSGGKYVEPWAYRVFAQSERDSVVEMLRAYSGDLSQFLLQKALIDPDTNETYLLFVDGAVNGAGEVFFNSIAEKWMKNPDALDGHITHRAGIRRVSPENKYGFKTQVAQLLRIHKIRNTLFKVQAIVDTAANTCYINDWSWGVMPYTHLNILPPEYVVSQMRFAYDAAPVVSRPIDKTIVMHHIAFPPDTYDMSEQDFAARFSPIAAAHGISQAEPIRQEALGAVRPVNTDFYVLFGVACDSVEEGTAKLATFQSAVYPGK